MSRQRDVVQRAAQRKNSHKIAALKDAADWNPRLPGLACRATGRSSGEKVLQQMFL